MAKPEKCETCQKIAKTRKAVLKVYTAKGWKKENLFMCQGCIKDEGATLKYKEKAA